MLPEPTDQNQNWGQMYLVTNDKKYGNSLTNIILCYYDIFEKKNFAKSKKRNKYKSKK